MSYTTGTRTELEALATAADKLLGYPRAGVSAATGLPVDLPNRKGWTERHATVRKHPMRDEYAYPVDVDLTAALDDAARRKRMAAAELTDLDAARAAKAELDGTWSEE